jgi:hypothetical protein
VGTYLAQHIGLRYALLFSAGIRLVGFVLFTRQSHQNKSINFTGKDNSYV